MLIYMSPLPAPVRGEGCCTPAVARVNEGETGEGLRVGRTVHRERPPPTRVVVVISGSSSRHAHMKDDKGETPSCATPAAPSDQSADGGQIAELQAENAVLRRALARAG